MLDHGDRFTRDCLREATRVCPRQSGRYHPDHTGYECGTHQPDAGCDRSGYTRGASHTSTHAPHHWRPRHVVHAGVSRAVPMGRVCRHRRDCVYSMPPPPAEQHRTDTVPFSVCGPREPSDADQVRVGYEHHAFCVELGPERGVRAAVHCGLAALDHGATPTLRRRARTDTPCRRFAAACPR